MSASSQSQMNSDILAYNTSNHDWCLNNQNGQTGGGKALKDMTVTELKPVAKRMSIAGRSTMKKEELVKAIRKAAASAKRRR
jgi:hypothetical protein